MIKYVKRLLLRLLAHLGYVVIKQDALAAEMQRQSRSAADMVGALPASQLVPTLREIIRRVQPADQPPLEDYQLEMAAYHLKTGMGDAEKDFFPLYERCRKYTMTSWERLYALFLAVRYLATANVPGAFLECGVWRGGSMMMAALTLMQMDRTDRQLLLFDTYEGLPKPDESLDIDVWGNRGIDGWRPHMKTEKSSSWAYASLEEVRTNIESTDYPMNQVSFVKGMVEETLPNKAPSNIALLRLDTDWYSSTRHELEHLYPRLSRNGILILDDYGHFQGARKATDEYLKNAGAKLLLTRLDYAGRLAIKVE